MLDDSWDSASSPDVKKKSAVPNRNQKPDTKYNFPAPTSTKRSSYNDDSFDNDILFSPTNSQGSPAGSPDYKNRSYNYADSPAKNANDDYLANFVTESADLEDSILGGLLGGGRKPLRPAPAVVKPRSPQSKLEPIDANSSDYSSYNNSEKDYPTRDFTASKAPQTGRASPRRSSPPKSYKASNFRSTSPAGDLKPILSDDDSDFPISPAFGMKRQNSAAEGMDDKNFGTKRTEPVMSSFDGYPGNGFSSPGQKTRAQPSFDVTNDAGFLASLEREDELKASAIPVVKKFTDGLRPKTSAGRDALPPAGSMNGGASGGNDAPTAAKTADKEDDKEKDDTAGLAFIPSFLEPGRQNRRRRQLDTSPNSKSYNTGVGDNDHYGGGGGGGGGGSSGVGGMPKLNDLDLALGLSGPTTAPKKTFVDPFSAVDRKMPQLEKQAASAFAMDSDDSSSDDALLNRNRYGRKDSFVTTKPATGTTGNTGNAGASSAAAGGAIQAKTVSKEASTTFSASAAFPPSAQTAAAVTAPSRISTFTPAKPTVADAVPVPPLQAQNSFSNLGGGTNSKSSLNMSDSFEEIHMSGYKPSGVGPSETLHSNASLASLPVISPAASFRISNSAQAVSGGKNKDATPKHAARSNDFDEDSDDLDVSGIVRIDIEEDLLMPRGNSSTRASTTHKSPRSSGTGRPKSASRSPRASFSDGTLGQDGTRGTAAVSRMATSGLPASDSGSAYLSIRTNSPAGMLTAAVNNFDSGDGASSRRNSAANMYARPTSPVQSQSQPAVKAAPSFQEGLVRDRSASSAPPPAPTAALASTSSFRNTDYGSYAPTEPAQPSAVSWRSRDDATLVIEAREEVKMEAPVPIQPYVPADPIRRENEIHHEIERYKTKLTHPQPASFQHSVVHTSSEEREHYRILQDNNIQYIQEVIDQKRLIAHLESEISRLKDEANIKALRNQEEMLWVKEKYESEIKDIKIKNSIETEALERRQEDSLSSLRKLHAHEIESIKERFKSEEKFEQIAGQLRTTSGSIRFIEEQLQTKQRGVETMREGQIDARERLLADMEEKARERAEIAEAEGYRLKGILSHMEHVVSSLREQGNEEKERLRQEHARLQARQASFEAERAALQTRNMEELAYVKQRSKEVELELVKLTQEKQAQFEAIAAAQNKLDSERAEFNAFVAASKRALELTETRLKEEDARVGRMRNEMLMEKNSLEDRRAAAIRDIEGAEELRAVLVRAQQENETEKEELRRISQSYKAASEELMQHQRELQEQQEALEERELALREGFAQMKLAAGELSRREGAIKDSVQFLDRKRMALDRADRESMENRIVSAASFREWSVRQSAEVLPMPAPPSRYQSAPSWERRDDDRDEAPTAEDVFNKYDVFGTTDAGNRSSAAGFRTQNAQQPVRASADESYFQSIRHLSGTNRMSRSAEFDGGFDPRAVGNQSYFTSQREQNAPLRGSAEKENMYAQVLQSQQQEKPWIETFQSKLKQAFNQGSEGVGGDSSAHSRLPAELRTAQMALRQSRGQLARVSTSTINVQRLLDDESEFLKALQSRPTQPSVI